MAFKDIAGNSRVKKILRIGPPEAQGPEFAPVLRPDRRGKDRDGHDPGQGPELPDPGETTPAKHASPAGPSRLGPGAGFPDVMMIVPENRKMIKIEQMRFVKQMAYLKPFFGQRSGCSSSNKPRK